MLSRLREQPTLFKESDVSKIRYSRSHFSNKDTPYFIQCINYCILSYTLKTTLIIEFNFWLVIFIIEII